MSEPSAAVHLRPMRPDEYPSFVAHSKQEYARGIATQGGETEEFARAKSEADHAAILPQGLDTPGHWISVIEAGGEQVGILWLAERPHGREKECWIYDIEIDEAHRGRGFGRAAMELAEAEARSHGLSRIALNVFGGNEVARNLYRSVGYVETSVQMAKDLE
ncbi:MAG TPA: GNAT family N-acetyltransferase [Candidatus Limnocylindria bacterium]|nr:GNAT family N-acetyltransferase [Candidatus Limnocylindria bacterium]